MSKVPFEKSQRERATNLGVDTHPFFSSFEHLHNRATRVVIMVRETIRIIAMVIFLFLFPRPFSFLFRVVEPTRARSSFLKSPPPPRKVGFVDKNARSFLKRTTG